MPPSSNPGLARPPAPTSVRRTRNCPALLNPSFGLWFLCSLFRRIGGQGEREPMHSCRRSRLTRVLLPQRRRLPHQLLLLLPAAPSTQQGRRLVCWRQGFVEASGVSGNEDASSTTAAARAHIWRRGPTLRSLAMTDNIGVPPSRQAVCR